MKRTLVALAVLGSLTACGTSTASAGLSSPVSAPPPTTPTAIATDVTSPAAPSSNACRSGHVDVDVVVQAGPGDWTGGAQAWCLGDKTQVEVAQATNDDQVAAGQTPQCQIIAADPNDDQLTTWGQGSQTTKPRLKNILATFGNC